VPASYQLYSHDNLVVVTYTGNVTLQEVMAVREQGKADPNFDTAFDVIDDVSAAESSDIKFGELGFLSGKSIAKTGVKRALVAVTDFQKGMANMYKVLSESHGHHFKVFDDFDKARKWVLDREES